MFKKILLLSIIFILLSCLAIWLANRTIESSTDDLVYNHTDSIPFNKVGLLLGTSKRVKSGHGNPYFFNRIKAAVELFQAGKITFILISGDNGTMEYNEPVDMKKELIKNGIPEERIYLDYAGFRTYDSIVRMNKVFGQKKFTVISQEFHNRRAIYIASCKNLNAIGYNAVDVNIYQGLKTRLRELLARTNVFLDLLIDREPKFLGRQIEIK